MVGKGVKQNVICYIMKRIELLSKYVKGMEFEM